MYGYKACLCLKKPTKLTVYIAFLKSTHTFLKLASSSQAYAVDSYNLWKNIPDGNGVRVMLASSMPFSGLRE